VIKSHRINHPPGLKNPISVGESPKVQVVPVLAISSAFVRMDLRLPLPQLGFELCLKCARPCKTKQLRVIPNWRLQLRAHTDYRVCPQLKADVRFRERLAQKRTLAFSVVFPIQNSTDNLGHISATERFHDKCTDADIFGLLFADHLTVAGA